MELLTIVIPTRDRTDYLEKCLRSVYEFQNTVPRVIVSDNSRSNHGVIEELRRRYGFDYVRQSGNLSLTQHMNICTLELSSTPWVLLLHDDDELVPQSLGNFLDFLAEHKTSGVAFTGIQYIDEQGRIKKEWRPQHSGGLHGERALVCIGLDWYARAPGIFINVAAARAIGGFVEIGTTSADYVIACCLAYKYGAAFFPALVGRYRQSPLQVTDTSTPEKGLAWLEFCMRQADHVAETGCSKAVAEQIKDYLTWWTFGGIASRWFSSKPSFVAQTAHECLRRSPAGGAWQTRIRREYPFLFMRPLWLGFGLCDLTLRLRSYTRKAA